MKQNKFSTITLSNLLRSEMIQALTKLNCRKINTYKTKYTYPIVILRCIYFIPT